MSQYKVCKDCNKLQPVNNYNSSFNKRLQKYYLQAYCKQCQSNRTKNWAKQNPERVAIIRSKQTYKEASATHYKQWAKANPEKISIRNNKYRTAKATNETFNIRPSFMKRLYASPCVMCHSTQSIEADHVIPISKGGRNSEGNLIPLCKSCNTSKRDRFITEWRK